MNHSIHTADRATHLKIVVVALVCATAVAGVAIGARMTSFTTETSAARLQGSAAIIKASRHITVTARDDVPTIR
jgi:hypothetical protein